MKVWLYIFSIILCIVVVLGHGRNPGLEKTQTRDACLYKNYLGDRFNIHLMTRWFGTELSHFDRNSLSTVYFSPCGPIPSFQSTLGNSSSVALVSASGKAISYGSSSHFQSIYLPTQPASLEVMYGNGEACSTGVARKTIVTYTCSHLSELSQSFSNYKHFYPITSVSVEECAISITISTPFACPVEQYCSSIHSSKDCDNQGTTCGWMFGKCQVQDIIFGFEIGITTFLATSSVLLLFCCLCGLCAFCIIKRKKCKKAKKMIKKNIKKSKKQTKRSTKNNNNKAEKKNNNIEMDSFQMPYQLVPGGFVAVEEYSHVQGYPLMGQHNV